VGRLELTGFHRIDFNFQPFSTPMELSTYKQIYWLIVFFLCTFTIANDKCTKFEQRKITHIV